MSKDTAKPPKKRRRKNPASVQKVTITYLSDEQHWYCDMGHVGDIRDIADTPKGHNAIFVRDVGDRHYQDVKLTLTSK